MTAIDMRTRREEMRKHSGEQARSIFTLADINILQEWELANGYWPDSLDYDDIRTPWWLFMTPIGPVQIGWRKRVLHIQWSACVVRGIVTTDDVTKGDDFVHAYSVEKAVEYLRALRLLAFPVAIAANHAAVEKRRGHSGGCASTRGSGGDDCDCGWSR